MSVFTNLARAMKIAPYLQSVNDEQFKFIAYLAQQIDAANKDALPVFVFSDEVRTMVRALGIKGEVVVVSASEAHTLAELIASTDVVRAQELFNRLMGYGK